MIEALLASHPTAVTIAGPKSDTLIDRAEAFLNVHFPPSYREFLRRWGALGFGPEEIYGITGDNFETGAVPNGIWFTAQERSQGLPHRLVKEVPVVVWDVASAAVIGSKARRFDDCLRVRLQEASDVMETS